MENYDVRKQILTENKNKLLSDFGLIGLFTVILILILFKGSIPNPFLLSTPNTEIELEDDYKSGKRYIRVENAVLEYTGYYKENKKGTVIYNCYITSIEDMDYFVFVPASRSGDNPEDPENILYNYTFTAKISKDKELFDMVASDYDMTVDEFIKSYGVSDKVLNEARSDRKNIFVIWGFIFLFILGEIGYIVVRFLNMSKIEENRYIEELNRYGEINTVLDDINEDVRTNLKYNSTNVKIGEKWFVGFGLGKIFITTIDEIADTEKLTKAKKAYGFVKLGYYELFLKIRSKDDREFVFTIESDNEAEEIFNILDKNSTEAVEFYDDGQIKE